MKLDHTANGRDAEAPWGDYSNIQIKLKRCPIPPENGGVGLYISLSYIDEFGSADDEELLYSQFMDGSITLL